MQHRGERERAGLVLVSPLDERRIDRRRQVVDELGRPGAVGAAFGVALAVIDHELDHHGRGDRERERPPVAQPVPGCPVLERALVRATRVGRLALAPEGTHGRFGLGRERRGVERRDRGVHAQRRRGGRCDHFRRTGAAAGPLCMSIHSAIILHIVPIEDDNVHLSDAE